MLTQVPVPAAHAVHAPVQEAAEQQYPSLHAPVVHWAFCEHAPPGMVWATQAPPALQ
jgi:hypothetical protein